MTQLGKELRQTHEAKDLLADPVEQFGEWYEFAKEKKIPQYNAMCLATVDERQRPRARMVLLKDYDEQGFVFFTNYTSYKAQQLSVNPQASLVFYWHELDRQIRIDGAVEKITLEESEEYFHSRPIGSQIGAWASFQSQPIASRQELDQRYAELAEKMSGQVPYPEFWGGYRVKPDHYEFWINVPNRLHDRFSYQYSAKGWQITRLYP